MRVAVAVALAVGLVVLALVGRQVPQREAVVRGDEVDRRCRGAPGGGVEVGGAGQPVGEPAHAATGAAPGVPHRVAVAVVPLGPGVREAAHLVAPLAEVPRLGDELHGRQHRVLVDGLQEGAARVEGVRRAAQRAGQVEAEAVDVQLGDPVAQRVEHQLQGVRVAEVQRVAAAGVVPVQRAVAVLQPVVADVVQAAQRQRGSLVVALAGVVVDDVDQHLEAGGVQRPHHRPELRDLLAAAPARGVARVRREVAEGVVAPVVGQAAAQQVRLGHELVHRQQLDGGDTQADQVLDGGRVGQPGVGAAQLLRHARVLRGEALDVQLVDHAVSQVGAGRPVVAPVVRVVHDHRARDVRSAVALVRQAVPARGRAEHRVVQPVATGDRPGVRVDEQLAGVVPQAGRRVVRALDAVAVLLSRPDAGQVAVPDVTGAVDQRHLPLGPAAVEQAQPDGGGRRRDDGEAGAGAVPAGAERRGTAGPGQVGGRGRGGSSGQHREESA